MTDVKKMTYPERDFMTIHGSDSMARKIYDNGDQYDRDGILGTNLHMTPETHIDLMNSAKSPTMRHHIINNVAPSNKLINHIIDSGSYEDIRSLSNNIRVGSLHEPTSHETLDKMISYPDENLRDNMISRVGYSAIRHPRLYDADFFEKLIKHDPTSTNKFDHAREFTKKTDDKFAIHDKMKAYGEKVYNGYLSAINPHESEENKNFVVNAIKNDPNGIVGYTYSQNHFHGKLHPDVIDAIVNHPTEISKIGALQSYSMRSAMTPEQVDMLKNHENPVVSTIARSHFKD